MAKQPAVTEQTRANLRDAFWMLYADKPIEKITIREITDRAGYNRATFYLYYRDVYDLFAQVRGSILDDVRQLVDDGIMRDEQLDLSHHMGRIAELAQRYEGYLPLLMGEHGDPSFARELKDIIAPLLDRFILPEGQFSGESYAIVREFYLSGLLAAINRWMTADADDRLPLDQFIPLVVATVLR